MHDFLQYPGSMSRLLLKIVLILVIIRLIMFAIDLPIVQYVPIIDDIINLSFALMHAAAKGVEKLASKVVYM